MDKRAKQFVVEVSQPGPSLPVVPISKTPRLVSPINMAPILTSQKSKTPIKKGTKIAVSRNLLKLTTKSRNADEKSPVIQDIRSSPAAITGEIERQIPYSKNKEGLKQIYLVMNKMKKREDRLKAGEVTFDEQSMIDPISKLSKTMTSESMFNHQIKAEPVFPVNRTNREKVITGNHIQALEVEKTLLKKRNAKLKSDLRAHKDFLLTVKQLIRVPVSDPDDRKELTDINDFFVETLSQVDKAKLRALISDGLNQ